jgi:hypothetical protein
MKKSDILSLPEVQRDGPCRKAAKQYKNYCSIRRDLRNADQIVAHDINYYLQIRSNPKGLEQAAPNIFLVRAAFMHAVILYGRWFKARRDQPASWPAAHAGRSR